MQGIAGGHIAYITWCPDSVTKRSGEKVSFDLKKIEGSLLKAGQSTGEYEEPVAKLLAQWVVRSLSDKRQEPATSIEAIQDECEAALFAARYLETARAYIVYREQHKKLREDARTVVDVFSSINEYLDQLDWRVKANANQGYSLGGVNPQCFR